MSYKPEEFGVKNSVDINWMNTRLCPMPWHTQFKAQKSPSHWDYHKLTGGHDAMITVPKRLVQMLEVLT
jgi:hypothetical protein